MNVFLIVIATVVAYFVVGCVVAIIGNRADQYSRLREGRNPLDEDGIMEDFVVLILIWPAAFLVLVFWVLPGAIFRRVQISKLVYILSTPAKIRKEQS